MYCIIYAFFEVCYWKGVWNGIDCWLSAHYMPWSNIGALFIGSCVLFVTGFFRTNIMSPMGFVHDSVEDHVFGTDTVLHRGDETSIFGHLKDVTATTIIKTFVILVWYGVWTIEDQLFNHFKVDLAVSAWISYVRLLITKVPYSYYHSQIWKIKKCLQS